MSVSVSLEDGAGDMFPLRMRWTDEASSLPEEDSIARSVSVKDE